MDRTFLDPETNTKGGDSRMKQSSRRVRWWGIVLIVLVLLAAVFLIYVSDYYRADGTAQQAMLSSETVSVTETAYGWWFDGPAEDRALIFYPGAKVEETAYAPLLHLLAEEGMDACLVKMPFHFAFFKPNAAGSVLENHDYSQWYIGGHSLGGVFASKYAAEHPETFAGVVLFASYPIQKLPDPMTELLLMGSEDQVINWDRLESGRQYAPSRYDEYTIEGGNHAQFGSYGPQNGDGTAVIPAEEQIQETVSFIITTLGAEKSIEK